MAVQGTEPTSSANIKAMVDNLKTWASSQIATAINDLKKTTPQEKELFYNADGAAKGTYNANGCRIARIIYDIEITSKTYHYVIEVPFTSGDVKVDVNGSASSYLKFSKTGFSSSGVKVIRVVGII